MKRFSLWLCALWPGLLIIPIVAAQAPRQQPQPPVRKADAAAQAQDQNKDEPIDFNKARMLLQKQRRGEKLTPEEEAYLRKAQAARRAGQGANPTQPQRRPTNVQPRETTGLKPLTEMTADDRYKGEDGGLYGGGRNTPPDEHRRAAEAALARIQPLDSAGKPAPDGRIVFVSISMSNATQEFSRFKRLADADSAKSGKLTIVDCAQGGQAMAEWVDPNARPWLEAMRRIESASVTPEQVQVAWIKLANKVPSGDLKEHGGKLQRDTLAVIQNARAKFPNLQIACLSSRIYAGYAASNLNPEPYAYESAYVVRWLIQDQVKGKPELNWDASRGNVKAPVLLWGPYLWADGTTPRVSDKLTYSRDDLAGDGTHPSEQGRDKVARVMLEFYKTDPLARPWFARP
jgi:hypothetical protein